MIQKILLVLLVAAFASGQFARVDLGNGIAVTALDLVIGLTALYFLIFTFFKGKTHNIVSHVLFRPIAIFVGICTFSLLLNSPYMKLSEVFTASLYLVRWIALSLLFFYSLWQEKHFSRQMVVIMGFASLVLGYWQYFFFNSLKKFFPLGWDEHMYRMVGGFLDPNFAGALYVLFFLFALANFAKALKKNVVKLKVLYGVISTLSLIAIYLTFSRSALIMLVISVGVFLFLSKLRKFLLLSIITILVFFGLFSDVTVEGRNPFRVFSSEARITSAKEAITLISKSPFIGVGFNAYRYGQRRFGLPTDANLYISHAEAGTDNSFLFTFATTGIVGLIAFLYLLSRIIEYVRANKEESLYIRNAKIAGLTGLCINSFFINSLFFPMILCFLWLWLGTTENK